MNIGKKTLGLFFEIEDDKDSSKNQETTPKTNNTTTPSQYSQPSMGLNQDEVAKFNEYFTNLFEGSNLPGPDYYEFSVMVESMVTDVPVPTAFKSSFKALSRNGLTKANLIATANQYLDIVKNDSVAFNNALTEKGSVADKLDANVKSLEETIKKKQDLITAMTAEIEQHKIDINANKTEITNVFNKVNSKKNSYNAASQNMINKISEAIKNVENYIS